MELPPSQTNCGAISGDGLNIIDADTLLRLDIALPDHEEQLIFFQGMIIIIILFRLFLYMAEKARFLELIR